MSVEKEKIVGTRDEFGFTTFSNTLLQEFKDKHSLGVYCYFASLPPKWEFHKTHIQKECQIGEKKLRSILKILQAHGLVKVAQIRRENGMFAHWSLHVCAPHCFIESPNNQDVIDCAPLGTKRHAAKRLAQKQSYIINNNKININNKTLCASDDAPHSPVASPPAKSKKDDLKLALALFAIFWQHYPLKKDKKRALAIWLRDKLWLEHDEIMAKLLAQKEADWQYQAGSEGTPHPSTYLNGRRWEDDISLGKHGAQRGNRKVEYKPHPAELHSTVPDFVPSYDRNLYNNQHNMKSSRDNMAKIKQSLGRKKPDSGQDIE